MLRILSALAFRHVWTFIHFTVTVHVFIVTAIHVAEGSWPFAAFGVSVIALEYVEKRHHRYHHRERSL